MHKYFGLVVLVIVSSVVVSAKDETAYGCISYSFTCCTNVNYQVFSVTAATMDITTCSLLKYMFENELKNVSASCQQAYQDAYCVLSIPECCSVSNPVVYTTCVSLCENMFDACPSDTNLTAPCTTNTSNSVWYEPPCNDGSGGPC